MTYFAFPGIFGHHSTFLARTVENHRAAAAAAVSGVRRNLTPFAAVVNPEQLLRAKRLPPTPSPPLSSFLSVAAAVDRCPSSSRRPKCPIGVTRIPRLIDECSCSSERASGMMRPRARVGLSPQRPQRHAERFYVKVNGKVSSHLLIVAVLLSAPRLYIYFNSGTENLVLWSTFAPCPCRLSPRPPTYRRLHLWLPAHAKPGQGRPDDGRYLRGAPEQLQPAAGQRQQAPQGHQQLHQMRQR